MKTILSVLVCMLVMVLPASSQVISAFPAKYTILSNDIFLVSTPGVATYKTTLITLASNLNGYITVTATVTNAVARGSNLATTNPTSFGVFYQVANLTNMEFFNLKQGTNMVIYRDGSNIVLNSTGGGGAGEVTTAQLNTASNAVVTMLITNDTGTSNGVITQIMTSSNFIYSTETTRNAEVSNAVVALIASSGSTQFVVAAFGNATVTNTITANEVSVVNANLSTIFLTNALGSNQVRLRLQDLTNASIASGIVDGDLLAWHAASGKWTNRLPASFASTTQSVAAAIGTLYVTNKIGINTNPAAVLHILPTVSGTDYLEVDHTDGTRRFSVGVLPGFPTFGTVWYGNITPSAVNYGISGNGSAMHINGDSISLNSAGDPKMLVNALGNFTGSANKVRDLGSVAIAWRNTFTDSIATYRSNLIASAQIDIGVSGTNWTNSAVFTMLTNNVTVYIDASAATTVATVSKNGQQIAASAADSMLTVNLKPNEYVTIAYTGTAPTARWEPW